MYLTRAFLNPHRRGALRLLGDPHRLHGAVIAGFPPEPEPGRVLWRVDVDDPKRPTLWIVSCYQPDLTHLNEQAGWPTGETRPWTSRPYEPLLEQLKPGQRYAFRLTANPTRSIKNRGEHERGQRVHHVTAHHQVRWLLDRAERCGFSVLPSDVTAPGSHQPALQLQLRSRDKGTFTKRNRNERRRVTVSRVTFDGALEVTNADALRQTLTEGLGPAKAYGCGLLTLARLPSPQR